jgi:hypothetical protein
VGWRIVLPAQKILSTLRKPAPTSKGPIMQTRHDVTNTVHRRLRKAATVAALIANLAFGANLAAAQPTDAPESQNAGLSAVATLDPARVRLEQLAEREVKSMYRICARQAIERRLGSGEIAHCSVVYEVLLARHFGGNFRALLAWSRAQVD